MLMKESHRNVIAGSGNVKVSSIICTPSWGRTSNNEAGQFPRQPAGRKQLRVILVKWKQLKWLLVLPSVFSLWASLSRSSQKNQPFKKTVIIAEKHDFLNENSTLAQIVEIFSTIFNIFSTQTAFLNSFLDFFFFIKVTYCTFPYYLPYRVC